MSGVQILKPEEKTVEEELFNATAFSYINTQWVRGTIPVSSLLPLGRVPKRNILVVYGGSREYNFRHKIKPVFGESLAHLGHAVHLFDFRSNTPGNIFNQHSLFDRYLDTRAVYEWLVGESGYNQCPTTVIGVSMGGPLAIRLAEQFPAIQELILIAPAAYSRFVFNRGVRFGPRFKKIINLPVSWITSQSFAELQRVGAPVLLIIYLRDNVIPI